MLNNVRSTQCDPTFRSKQDNNQPNAVMHRSESEMLYVHRLLINYTTVQKNDVNTKIIHNWFKIISEKLLLASATVGSVSQETLPLRPSRGRKGEFIRFVGWINKSKVSSFRAEAGLAEASLHDGV